MERRRERENRARSWSWLDGEYEGLQVEAGYPYLVWDGSALLWTPVEAERYVFSVYESRYLVGSSIVDVYPRAMLPELQTRETRQLIGPLFFDHDPEEVLHGVSIRVEHGHPVSVFHALVDAGRAIGLPTYVAAENERLGPIFERRYRKTSLPEGRPVGGSGQPPT